MTMQATTMSVWKAFRRTGERYKRGDCSASNYWVAYCIGCEAAYERYREALAACNGDDEAIAKIGIVPPAVPLPGRADRMAPHLKTCQFTDATSLDVDTAGRENRRSDATPEPNPSPPAGIVSRESEQDLCRRLGLSSAQFHGVRNYLSGQAGQAAPGPKRRRSDINLTSYFSRDLSASEKAELDKRLLILVADRRLPFSFVESEAFIDLVRVLRQSAVSRIPSRRQLGGTILDAAATHAKTQSRGVIKSILRGSARATLMLDGYKTSDGTHILGAVIGIGPEHFVLNAKEEGYEHDGVAMANEIAAVIEEIERDADFPIGCVCTDEAGQCG